jgi:hypothetical protein
MMRQLAVGRQTATAVFLSVVCFAIAGGCASQMRHVDIDSKPSGATLFVNGEKIGVTRAEKVKLDFAQDPSRRVLVQVVKPRYRPVFPYWTLDEVPENKVFALEAE